MLISAGQPANVVASGLTAVNLLSAAVLLLLPVLTIPALIIGPPPARQLQLGVVDLHQLSYLVHRDLSLVGGDLDPLSQRRQFLAQAVVHV